MLKKSVFINEDNNEIIYIKKRKEKDDYLDTIFKYLCTSTETTENIKENYNGTVLRNGKKLINNLYF